MDRGMEEWTEADLEALARMANRLRRDAITMTTAAGSGHPTSAMSCAEIVAALFFHVMRWDPAAPEARDVDTFVLSKGHASPVLWAALHEAGAISEPLESYRRIDSTLEGHPTPRNPWVRVATGSLGQGLSVANGIALANRLDGIDACVYCLLGDGECSEGAVWEAAQFASLNGAARVVAIVDLNGLEQSTATPYRHDSAVLARRFQAFGWTAIEIDGHHLPSILLALRQAAKEGPTVIVARTEKGKGVSFLEGKEGWHGKALSEEQRDQALAEIGETGAGLRVEPRRLGQRTPLPEVQAQPLSLSWERGTEVATREGFGHALRKLGDQVPRLVAIDGDVNNSTYTKFFADAFPERFFQGFIAEQNMVGVAAGLASSGFIPCVSTFAAFLSRAYDFIRMAGHSRLRHLVLNGSHAGIAIGEDGPSQMGLEDIAMMRAVAGSTILYPADAVAAERLTEVAVQSEGIVYLRTTRGKTPVIYDGDTCFIRGGCHVLRASGDDRLTIVAAGVTLHEALAAWEQLQDEQIPVRVVDAYSIKPLAEEVLLQCARETGAVLVVEDHWCEGGLGDAVAVALCNTVPVLRLAVRDEPRSGTPEELLQHYGIDRRAIIHAARELVR
jgi:transketolase